jgi:hypothetical protein
VTLSAGLSEWSLKVNGPSPRARFTDLPTMTASTVEGWMKRAADSGRFETFSKCSKGYRVRTADVMAARPIGGKPPRINLPGRGVCL